MQIRCKFDYDDLGKFFGECNYTRYARVFFYKKYLYKELETVNCKKDNQENESF